MKKYNLFILSMFIAAIASSQEVVVVQGDSYSNQEVNLDFTIGEVVISTETDGFSYITQGYHQTRWNLVGLEDFAPTLEASIFPNPTQDRLNIKTRSFQNVIYELYDGQGRLVMQESLMAEVSTIEVGHLAVGSYSIILKNANRNLKTFKLIKQQQFV